MYSRKLKALKKKSKTGIKSNEPGSTWGPRLALYEREREQAKELQKQQIYQNHNTSASHQISSSSSGISSTHHYGLSRRSHQEEDSSTGTQRLRHSNNGNHHYNKASSDVTISTGRLSSASGGGGHHNGNLSKPLSVIIPPPPPTEHFLPSSDFGPDRDSLPSTKTWRSSSPEKGTEEHDKNKTVTEVQVHMSSSSSLSNHNNNASNSKPLSGLLSEKKVRENKGEKMKQLLPGLHSGKLIHVEMEKGSKESTYLHQLIEYDEDEDEDDEEEDEEEEDTDLRQRQRATVAALKQGLAMIYVPMEQAALRRKSTNSPETMTAGVEEMLHTNEVITTSSSPSSAETSPKNTKQKDSIPINETKDADGDSLLESFDSVIFKPRSLSTAAPESTGSSANSSPKCTPSTSKKSNSPIKYDTTVENPLSSSNGHQQQQSQQQQQQHPQSRQRMSESPPPPLPPLNDSMIMKPSATKKTDKNLRFSEQLESIQPGIKASNNNGASSSSKPLLGKKVPIPTAPHPPLVSQNSQKEAQSEVTEVKDITQFTTTTNITSTTTASHSSTSRDDSSMTVLSCGHVKTASNYSTLSSITSSLTDEEGLNNNTNNSNNNRDTRSAIQQLRDLSLLIGGNFHETNEREQAKNNRGASVVVGANNNNKSKRRDSQESSGADSGKGSGGSGQSPMMLENSPKEKMKLIGSNNNILGYSHHHHHPHHQSQSSSSCVFGKPDCDDCFMVFKNPLASSSDSSHSSGTSPLSCPRGGGGEPCENHHRRHHHLIIPEQSKLSKQSVGKSRGSHSSSGGSSSSHHSASGHGSKKPKKSKKHHKKSHELVFEYCDCRHCDCRGKPPPELSSSRKTHQIGLAPSMNFSGSSCSSSGSNSSRDSPSHSTGSPDSHHNNNNNNNLFTIDEEEIADVLEFNARNQNFMDETAMKTGGGGGLDKEEGKGRSSGAEQHNHWHPKCWLAPDPSMGWSDLESLYSQNMKLDKPVNINDECWTCWREVAELKRLTGTDSNRTIDRTKRMFIWLNKRHKEFNAPWWEAKKQASIRWLITKAFAHLPKEAIGDPFKESKKGKPKYRLKDEVIKGLVNGKLYCLVLDHLYQNQHYRSRGLSHWDIIKILSRRGVYVAQPSDMKLTEGTLRQRKPLRIAAHIALTEAIMSLYCKEALSRDRVIATLNSLGQTVDPDVSTAEELLIAWINASMLTLKSYILSSSNNKSQKLPCGRLNRWLNVPQVQEIRDLCDGIGICSLFALYCSSDLQVSEIAVPEPNDMLNIYETIANHAIIERLCQELFPEKIYHLRITDFLYIHGYMKQNILSFLVDLFHHLEINPIIRVNRLTHVPVRLDL